MNLYDIIPVLIGGLIGGLITWLISRRYYKNAGDMLKQEAEELRRLTNLILRGLENAGIVKLARDPSGKATGLIIRGAVVLGGTGRLSAKAEVIKCKSGNGDAEQATDVDRCGNSG